VGLTALKLCVRPYQKVSRKTGSENGTTVVPPTAREKVGSWVRWQLGQGDHEIVLIYQGRLVASMSGVELQKDSSGACTQEPHLRTLQQNTQVSATNML
jgi:hypothetical protein